MENEEKEDLLLEVTESEDEIYEKEIDYYIEKKILDYLRNENPKEKFRKKTSAFIATCLLVFLSSSVLIVALPIYLKYSSSKSISTYSKLLTLSLVNAVFFIIAHLVGILCKYGSHTTPSYNLYLGDVLKVSFLLSVGNILVFSLSDGNYLSCHLRDPLKGSSIVFSLLFYFVFSRKKMSLEKTFSAITITIGVFISVDFGICDKFLCNGNSNLTEDTPNFHFLYVIFYLLAHGIWVLHFVFVEVCWSTVKGCTSNLNVSVLSKVSCNANSGTETLKPSVQSLSIICQEDQEDQPTLRKETFSKSRSNKKFSHLKCPKSGKGSENSFSSLVPPGNQLSVPDFNRFPITSTPNNEMDAWQSLSSGRSYDLALWQHITCFLIVLGLCWLPTLSVFHGGKSKLLVDVVTEVIDSFWGHFNYSGNSGSRRNHLPEITVLLSVSYVILILSSIEVLKITQSAVTVVSVMMPALPVASLFWSLFRLGNANNILEFSPEITGEAVCAVLGFPIIGIGIVLLMKSHIREFHFAM